jgi:hypothetical protein
MATTNETVAVMKIGAGKVHAGARVEFLGGWAAACSGRFIGSDYETITESAAHINCARCAARLATEAR